MDQQYGFNNPQPNQFNNIKAPNYMLWLILGIIQTCTFCCCSFIGLIFGILTIVFAVQANNCFKQGNIVLYQARIKTAMILNIVGWIIMIISFIVGMLSGVIQSIINAIAS